jgi:hypothetical protein
MHTNDATPVANLISGVMTPDELIEALSVDLPDMKKKA